MRILDLVPDDLPLEASEIYKSFRPPLHGAVFIDSIDPHLRFRILDADSLKHYIQRHPRAIAHVTWNGVVVLTAQTTDLQSVLATCVRRTEALGRPNVMSRRSP